MMGTVQRFGWHVTAALLGQVTIAAAIDARAPNAASREGASSE